MSEQNQLGGVAETMLQTLYARAKESRKPDHKIYDAKAVEIVGQMEYDFSLADKDLAMSSGVVARTIVLDRMVSGWIQAHPDATVVNIACGMDTRFYRVDNGRIRWYDLDLPVTMEVRERYIPAGEHVTYLAASAMDEGWAGEIEPGEGDVLVIVEGLTMYLEEADVRQILRIIDRRFAAVTVYMETLNPRFVRKRVEKSIQASGAVFTWGAKDGRELTKLAPAFRWVEDVSLVEGMVEIMPVYRVIGRIGLIRNLSNRICVLEKG
ncbi:MAG: class I SAM-dependent methyltransferase [Oscillospiraceae bacterium]|nr:class I SAM-dependent methyltransferase [Oscillospiraceae bacterium]